jgi:hypothetical protein
VQQSERQRRREGVSGPDRVGHLDGRGGALRTALHAHKQASLAPARERDQPERVAAEERLELFVLAARQAQHRRHDRQFLVVEFEHVRQTQRRLHHFLPDEGRPQVDVEDPQGAGARRGHQPPHSRGPASSPLRQTPEADGVRGPHRRQRRLLGSEPVPGDALVDGEPGLVVRPKFDSHGPRRCLVIRLDQVGRDPTSAKLAHGLAPQVVAADPAHQGGLGPQRAGVLDKVGRRTAELPPGREQVPQDLTDRDDLERHSLLLSRPGGQALFDVLERPGLGLEHHPPGEGFRTKPFWSSEIATQAITPA